MGLGSEALRPLPPWYELPSHVRSCGIHGHFLESRRSVRVVCLIGVRFKTDINRVELARQESGAQVHTPQPT